MPDRYLGRQIGKYRVIRLLGAGAFAWVYEAIDRDLEIPVALKILRPEFAGQEAAEARFRREAALAARLRHPNIVTVRDVGQTDGASFVAMDLLPLSLARRLELLRRLPEPEVVRIGLDVAAALAIAHAGGIVHRDIKPDNILIGTNGEAVVADFGLARALASDASLSATNQVMGTPHYFSPEQARGQELDGRSDLYSLGVMLFRTLSGRLPFEGDDWYAVAKQHVETPAPLLADLVPEVTPGFSSVVARLLAKLPDDRYDTATQVADALATLPTAPPDRSGTLTPVTTSLTQVNLAPFLAPTPSRRWVWIGVASFAGAAALLALAQRNGVFEHVGSGPARVTGDTALRGVAGIGGSDPADERMQRVADSLRASGEVPGGAAGPGDSQLGAGTGAVGSASGSGAGATTGAAGTSRSNPAAPPRPPGTRTRSAAAERSILSVSAPENARLYVDSSSVGSGSWTGEHAPAVVTLRAVIADASQNDCPTAQRDTTVRLARGQRLDVRIPVRACVRLELSVVPAEALVVFTPLDGGSRIETRADAVPLPLLTSGRYVVSATSPRCSPYSGDTVVVTRKPDNTPWLLRVRMLC